MSECVCVCVCVCVSYIHTHIHTCIHTYILTYIHTHIHTYMHAYIHTQGPGEYDEEYLDYLLHIVRKAGLYNISLFVDPHQDVWCVYV